MTFVAMLFGDKYVEESDHRHRMLDRSFGRKLSLSRIDTGLRGVRMYRILYRTRETDDGEGY